ncbi:MAG: hypothetical protein K2X48_12075 [Chitinophagaceae bacterium]|nr:hypothetical protein [Chitinophagaceae bacterium]
MKAIILFPVFIFSVAHYSFAQTSDSARQQQKELRKQMAKDAGITRTQGKQLKELNMDFKQKADSVRNDKTLSDVQKKEKRKQLETERAVNMKKV